MNTISKKALFISLVIISLLIGGACTDKPKKFDMHRIAHAGGGIESRTYTNSYEALNYNLQRGFKLFELDFSFTNDGRIVCLHDWHSDFEHSFGFKTKAAVSYDEFKKLVKNKSKFNKCTLDGLAQWMKNHPSTIIVTDVKESNLNALATIVKTLPSANQRVIPQIYQPEHYLAVKKMGFEFIIWTLYRYSGNINDVLRRVDEFKGPFAITMPTTLARTTLPKNLSQRGIPTYVHTVNDHIEAKVFKEKYGVTEIYTDFLAP